MINFYLEALKMAKEWPKTEEMECMLEDIFIIAECMKADYAIKHPDAGS